MDKTVDIIVTRHEATLDWLREEAAKNYGLNIENARIINNNATIDDVAGKIVIGNLPMALAAVCDRFFAVEFSGPPPRGQEYGINEMRAAGARLVEYQVRRV